MKLLIANDGLYGVDNGKTITWFHNFNKACEQGESEPNGWLKDEFMMALGDCIMNKNDVAVFGVNGTLIYTRKTLVDAKI
jgi:hypothetical protein